MSDPQPPLYHFVSQPDGTRQRVAGAHPGLKGSTMFLHGDCTNVYGEPTYLLRGDLSQISGHLHPEMGGNIHPNLTGDVSGLRQDISGIAGDATGYEGDCGGKYGDVRELLAQSDRQSRSDLRGDAPPNPAQSVATPSAQPQSSEPNTPPNPTQSVATPSAQPKGGLADMLNKIKNSISGALTRTQSDPGESERVTLGGLRDQVEDAREREVEGQAHRG